jgi:hypothetical protein
MEKGDNASDIYNQPSEEVIQNELVLMAWNEILSKKITTTKDLTKYNIKVSSFKNYEDFVNFSSLAKSESARRTAGKSSRNFHVINFVLKDHRVLGGCFHVFINSKREVVDIVSGV